MSDYTYNFKKSFLIWKCERIHKVYGLCGVGYGLTEHEAWENSWKQEEQ